MNRAVTMRNVWRVAETYPIEGLWETQIVVNAEVVAVAKGHDRAQSKRRAAVICAGYEMRNALKTAKELDEREQTGSELL